MFRFVSPLCLTIALSLGAIGCKSPAQRARVLTKDQEKQLAANVSKSAPKMQHAKKVDFEDRLSLLGYDISGEPKAGASIDLTLYFQVHKAVAGDWKIFIHLEAPGKRRQPFDHHGVGGLYPVAQWQAGEYIKDTVRVAIPKDWPNGDAQLLVGFFDWGAWSKSNQNRRLRLAASSKKLGTPDNRALVTTLKVTGGAATSRRARAPKVPQRVYTALKVSQAPTLDGVLSEWQAAKPTENFLQPDSRRLNKAYQTNAKLLWDDQNLYVAFETKDDDVVNRNNADDGTLWEGDVAELFLQRPGEKKYYEFQWTPAGKRFDAQFTSPRKPAWQEAAKWNANGKSAVKVDGTVNKAGDTDKGWTVEAAIPWSAVGGAPKAGETWTLNLYRIDSKGTHNIAFMGAWAPVGGDFHRLVGAGRVTFSAGK